MGVLYTCKYETFLKSVEHFKELAEKLTDLLQAQLGFDELELLRLIVEEGVLVAPSFDILRDVDYLERQMRESFGGLSSLLDEFLVDLKYFEEHRELRSRKIQKWKAMAATTVVALKE